ncbi:MAG: methyltransferase domain-containing protein [Patescibacteria group bacterium]
MESKNFLDPNDIIKQIDILQGSVVADFGCGSGFFSLAFAQKIGEGGKVYSLDILPSALESVESKAKLQGLANIVPRRANLEKEGGSKLGDDSIDWVIMKDMLFQNKMKDIILKEALRILKPGGKVLLIEWNDHDALVGPEKGIRVSRKELDKLAENQGLKKEKELVAGDFHYGAVYAK